MQAKQLADLRVYGGTIAAMADPEGLRTIIDNLIGNAINYEIGGWVIVRPRA